MESAETVLEGPKEVVEHFLELGAGDVELRDVAIGSGVPSKGGEEPVIRRLIEANSNAGVVVTPIPLRGEHSSTDKDSLDKLVFQRGHENNASRLPSFLDLVLEEHEHGVCESVGHDIDRGQVASTDVMEE